VEEEEEEPSAPLANSGNSYTQEGEGLAMDPKLLQAILAKRRVAADEHAGKFILILTICCRVSQRARK
jgi:hypothetical protein